MSRTLRCACITDDKTRSFNGRKDRTGGKVLMLPKCTPLMRGGRVFVVTLLRGVFIVI